MKKIKVEAEIVRRNLEFKNKTNVEKRVLIAKDVINQLNRGKIKARSGVFVNEHYKNSGISDGSVRNSDGSVRNSLLSGYIKKCDCCALGSLFVSCTLYNNQTTTLANDLCILSDIKLGCVISNGLNEIFDKDQLILIEQVFENKNGYFKFYIDVYDDLSISQSLMGSRKISRYHRRNGYTDGKFDARKLLIRIMKNIIKNKGNFIPFTVD